MVYVDYTYYKNEYCGIMEEADFKRLSRQASAYIDQVTFNRAERAVLGQFGGKIKDACCAVADAYSLNEKGGGVVSETNDGISVNYALGISTAKSEDQRVHDAVSLYLASTGLMYRGV